MLEFTAVSETIREGRIPEEAYGIVVSDLDRVGINEKLSMETVVLHAGIEGW